MNTREKILEVRDLKRVLGPNKYPAVDGVSFDIFAGEVVCLLGPNGAGKTTTVKMCSTILAPSSGSVVIRGIDAVKQPRLARRSLGLVLGGDRGFYSRASALDNLLFFADVAGVPRGVRRENALHALSLVGLTERMRDPVQAYSKGMQQRLHIARGLVAKPRLLLLDEPTSGLDPEIALEIRKLVRELANTGVAILLTTHYLREAELLADGLKLLQRGKITASGSVLDLAAKSGVSQVTTLTTSYLDQARLAAMEALPGVLSVYTEAQDQRTLVTVAWGQAPDEFALGKVVSGTESPDDLVMTTRCPTLEESYLALVLADPSQAQAS